MKELDELCVLHECLGVQAAGATRLKRNVENLLHFKFPGSSSAELLELCLDILRWMALDPGEFNPGGLNSRPGSFCRTLPEPRMYTFVRGTKLRFGTDSLKNRTCRQDSNNGLGHAKDKPARGYSVVVCSRHIADQALFVTAQRRRFCLTLYFSLLREVHLFTS